MLQVAFGTRWYDASPWAYDCALHDDSLYIWLDFQRLAADRRTVSITRARWRYAAQEFETVRTSVSPGQQVVLVVARRVVY